MIVTKITTHVSDGLNRLLEQYKGKTGITGILTAMLKQVQDLEDALYPIDQLRQLAFAFGQQLDGLGEIIGFPRNGLQDPQYLVLLLGTMAENNSDTTAEVLLNIVQTVYQATGVFKKDPNSPGGPEGMPPAAMSFGVGSPQTPSDLFPICQAIVQNSVGAAIAVSYISSFNSQGAFAMAGPQSWVKGFGDLNNPSTGGGYASLVFSNPTQ